MQFKGSPTTSIGTEFELQLLDGNSLDLVDGILPLLENCPDTTYVKPEYIQYTVEIASKVCENVRELEQHMLSQVAMLDNCARGLGMRLAASGTHPFCSRLGRVTPSPRYHRVEKDTGYVGYSQITYALHVHVGVRSGEEAIRLMHRLRPYLGILLALSANSPYWQSHETGFASYRQRVLVQAHAFGSPPPLDNWTDFERLVTISDKAHIFDGFSDMHWDLRPRPDYGTLELRIMDAQPTVAENMALAAVVHALVAWLQDVDEEAGVTLPTLPLWLEQENHYRTSHNGQAADYIIDSEGSTRPLHDVALEMLESVAPYSRQLGEAQYLADAFRMLREGGNAQLQKRLARQHGSLREVVGHFADALSHEIRRETRLH